MVRRTQVPVGSAARWGALAARITALDDVTPPHLRKFAEQDRCDLRRFLRRHRRLAERMTRADEIARLRGKAAELIEQSARRDRPLSPAEDAEILALLEQAQELEIHDEQGKEAHDPTN